MKTVLTEEGIKQLNENVADWDLNKSLDRVGEELLELGLALKHYARGKATVAEVLSEMADVNIGLTHLEQLFGSYQAILDEKVKKKS